MGKRLFLKTVIFFLVTTFIFCGLAFSQSAQTESSEIPWDTGGNDRISQRGEDVRQNQGQSGGISAEPFSPGEFLWISTGNGPGGEMPLPSAQERGLVSSEELGISTGNGPGGEMPLPSAQEMRPGAPVGQQMRPSAPVGQQMRPSAPVGQKMRPGAPVSQPHDPFNRQR